MELTLHIPSLHVHVHQDQSDILTELSTIKQLITQLGEQMAVDFTAANAEIARNTTLVGSLTTLLTTLTTEISTISASSTDTATQASLDALVAGIKTNDDAIAAAVAANTPAAKP